MWFGRFSVEFTKKKSVIIVTTSLLRLWVFHRRLIPFLTFFFSLRWNLIWITVFIIEMVAVSIRNECDNGVNFAEANMRCDFLISPGLIWVYFTFLRIFMALPANANETNCWCWTRRHVPDPHFLNSYDSCGYASYTLSQTFNTPFDTCSHLTCI